MIAVKRGGSDSNVFRKKTSPGLDEDSGCYLEMGGGIEGAVAIPKFLALPKEV